MEIDKITSIYAPPLTPSPLAPGRSSQGLHICAHSMSINKLDMGPGSSQWAWWVLKQDHWPGWPVGWPVGCQGCPEGLLDWWEEWLVDLPGWLEEWPDLTKDWPDLLHLCHEVVLIVKQWSLSQMCCLSWGDYLVGMLVAWGQLLHHSQWSFQGLKIVIVVGDLLYILIGSAGMELKAKNIHKKALKSLKTAF